MSKSDPEKKEGISGDFAAMANDRLDDIFQD